MITYLCPQCGMDFAITELQKPKCFCCQAVNMEFIVTKKQKLTPKVMINRLKFVNDRMMENLHKAYMTAKESGEDCNEGELIDIMAKAKKLHDGIDSLETKNKKNK